MLKQALTPEEKAIYLELLQDLINAGTELEIKRIEDEILKFLSKARELPVSIEAKDEKAAAAHYIRAGILKN
ncbi:hypothetical protein [Gottfriedia sp. OAE603]|uniref:hypothetical protein n=1 Tax=Gottfriedia sp. OAE603 TaxID=2663872 RepID=UPI0019FEA86E